jgi:hypothetical protein
MLTKILRLPQITITACAIAACNSSEPATAPVPGETFTSQGVVAGLVRDEAGRGVANAIVCAVAVFDASGTPVLVSRQASTIAGGAYLVPVNLTFRTNVRAGLGVTANPALGSGLEPKIESGLTLLITTTLPPAETTHVDMVLAPGNPSNNVFCVSGG